MTDLSSKIRPILGDKTAKSIRDALGYETVGELIGHYPRTYIDRGQTSDDSDFVEGEIVTLVAAVLKSTAHTYKDRRTGHLAYRLEVLAQVGESKVVMTFFDRKRNIAEWRAKKMKPGLTMMVAGKAQ